MRAVDALAAVCMQSASSSSRRPLVVGRVLSEFCCWRSLLPIFFFHCRVSR